MSDAAEGAVGLREPRIFDERMDRCGELVFHAEGVACRLDSLIDLEPCGLLDLQSELYDAFVAGGSDDAEHLGHLEPCEQPLHRDQHVPEIALDKRYVRRVALGQHGGAYEVDLRLPRGAREGVHIHIGELVRPRGESAREALEPTPVRGIVHVPRLGVELVLDLRVHFRHESVHRVHERVQREARGECHVGCGHAPCAHGAQTLLGALHSQYLAVRVPAAGDVAEREAPAEHVTHLARIFATQPFGRLRPSGDEQLDEREDRVEQWAEFLVITRLEEVEEAGRQVRSAVRERCALGLLDHCHSFGATGEARQSFGEVLQAVVRDDFSVIRDFLDPHRVAGTQVPAPVGAEDDGPGAHAEEREREELTAVEESDAAAFAGCREGFLPEGIDQGDTPYVH